MTDHQHAAGAGSGGGPDPGTGPGAGMRKEKEGGTPADAHTETLGGRTRTDAPTPPTTAQDTVTAEDAPPAPSASGGTDGTSCSPECAPGWGGSATWIR